MRVKGNYNSALFMSSDIDEETLKQVKRFLNNPVFEGTNIAIMADAHAGKGSCIGFTMDMNKYIIPNIIGVDIGCGVLAVELGNIDIDFEKLDKFIRGGIPSGFDKRKEKHPRLKEFEEVVDKIKKTCSNLRINSKEYIKAIGTLGGGNHFIEIDDNEGCLWLMIHTGSRKFGLDVASFYQKRARKNIAENIKKYFGGLLADDFKELEFLHIEDGGNEYLKDMKTAQEFAVLNRELIAGDILAFLKVKPGKRIESVHNYVNFSDKIIRKGAISAHKGEEVVIPLNMRDGVISGVGKGAEVWNYSAPHGAGRVYSRKKAKSLLSLEKFKKEMEGIWTTSVSHRTLDESPMAYKDKDVIMNAIREVVDIKAVMRPVYNFKAS